MTKKGYIEVDPQLANNPDYMAYQEAFQKGELAHLPAGTWVAFHDGKLLATNMDRDALFQQLEKQATGGFYKQVGVPEEIVDLPSLIL